MLEQVYDALWVSEGEIDSFFGLPYPTRSVIARLANGDLWVDTPISAIAPRATKREPNRKRREVPKADIGAPPRTIAHLKRPGAAAMFVI